MKPEIILIESYDHFGRWDGGLSTNGPNPLPEDFVPTPCMESAKHVKELYERWNKQPFLVLSGTSVIRMSEECFRVNYEVIE